MPRHDMSDDRLPVRRVAVLGVDERMRNALELLFRTHLKNRFVLSDSDTADLHLIDLDSYDGLDLWIERARARPDSPFILLSIQDVDVRDNMVFVRKPLTSGMLVTALQTATERLNADVAASDGRHGFRAQGQGREKALPQSPEPGAVDAREVMPSSPGRVGSRLAAQDIRDIIGRAPDIDPGDPLQAASVRFQPDDYLVGRLRQAMTLALRAGQAARVELDHGSITLVPGLNQAHVDLIDVQLRTLATIPLSESTSRIVPRDQVGVRESGGLPHTDLETLLWDCALLASRGRVPAGTDLDSPIRLRQWPNLTRLSAFPHAVRITALLTREALSLPEAARRLRIPQRYVFAFFTAADTLGLVQREGFSEGGGAGDATQPASPASGAAKRNLLQRILAHLRR